MSDASDLHELRALAARAKLWVDESPSNPGRTYAERLHDAYMILYEMSVPHLQPEPTDEQKPQ